MRILINRKPIDGPYDGVNLLGRALCELLPEYGFEVSHGPIAQHSHEIFHFFPDVIFLQDPRPGNTGIGLEHMLWYKENVNPNVRIVHRVNECDVRKGTTDVDDMLRKTSRFVDDTIFVSEWIKNYHVRHASCRVYGGGRHHVIYNGVDRIHFQCRKKIDNGKINLVSAHWSDNYLKGQDVTEWLDDFVSKNEDFTFTFIGRTKANLKHSRHVQPLFGQSLGDELSRYDVCINATRFDPGPNSVIEPVTCGIPTYVHCDGGGAVEFAGADHTFATLDELESLLLRKKFEANSIIFDTWQDMIKKYVCVLKHETSIE